MQLQPLLEPGEQVTHLWLDRPGRNEAKDANAVLSGE